MTSLLADTFNGNQVRLTQSTGKPTSAALAGIDQLLLVIPPRMNRSDWRKVPQGEKIRALLKRRLPGRVPAASSRLNNKRQTGIQVAIGKAQDDSFQRLTQARRLVAAALQQKSVSLGIWVLGFAQEDEARLAGELASAALAAAFPMPTFSSKPAKPPIRSVRLLGLADAIDLDRISAEAEGNNLCRWLTALPANKLDASAYASVLRDLAGTHGWQYKKFGVSELKKKGAGAFLAVAQGNADDSACIVRLRYRPAGAATSAALSLVGKGIIFDTGGTNLKPFASMLDMHIDMGGSAVAVGTLLTLTRLGVQQPVDCWLAITENRAGPTAYKSQDVVTAANGKTIQTIHTDAEGRMALADTLVFACEDKPALVLDFATLTGACMNAVTTRYAGVFTNRPDLHPVLKKCGQASGERVWPFPTGKEFMEELKSDTADFKQCSPSGGGDHILAASFLNEFVDPKIPWVHVDLSAMQRKGGLAHIPTDITGFGVRFATWLLVERGLLRDPAAAKTGADDRNDQRPSA